MDRTFIPTSSSSADRERVPSSLSDRSQSSSEYMEEGGMADPVEAFGAFERYSDESGLSAQEELRLLKAQVQDIARVCKVRGKL